MIGSEPNLFEKLALRRGRFVFNISPFRRLTWILVDTLGKVLEYPGRTIHVSLSQSMENLGFVKFFVKTSLLQP